MTVFCLFASVAMALFFSVVAWLWATFFVDVLRHLRAKEKPMSEPTTTVAGGIAGYKLMLLSLPVVAAVVGFWLGLRFVPLRKGHELEDVTNRMTACAVSSFVLGIPALALMQHYMPWSMVAAQQMAVLLGLLEVVGVFVLAGCVFLVCSIPGPWLIAAVFLYMERRKGKDIAELVTDAKKQATGQASEGASNE